METPISTERTKTAARHADLRERLVAAGREAVAQGGLNALKARDLAAAAGCAVGAIYTVFDDLDELVLRIGADTLAALERALAPPAEAAEANPVDELLRLSRGYLEFARACEKPWRALFEHRLGGRAVPAWFLEDQDRLFALIEAPLARLLPNEPVASRAQLARALFSAVHGVVSLGLEEKLSPTPQRALDAALERLTRALAEGLAAERGGQSPGSCGSSIS
jgi:AcrR family transcriptional regulator